MNINLTPIFEAVIMLIAALITYKLIPYIKAHTTEKQQKNLNAAVQIAVYAAEQLYGAGNGPEKLRYAQKYLAEHGFDVDAAAIEAKVAELFNYGQVLGTIHDGEAEPEEEPEIEAQNDN